MANEEPFILFKRNNSPYYQVKFKNPDKNSTVRYFTSKSTKETIKSKAVAKAWSMYNEEKLQSQSIVQTTLKGEVQEADVLSVLENLKARGMITDYSLPKETSYVLLDFLKDFWTEEKSTYLAEKKRMGKHIGLIYIEESRHVVEKFWSAFFDKDLLLTQITRNMLKDFISFIDTYDLSWSRKLKIYRAGAIALKWAYNEDLIDKDITSGVNSFYGKPKEKNLLTKEMAELLFNTEWDNTECKLINLIAMVSGMRAGEILALRKMDLGEDCIYVNHSWNRKEGLKTPKNGEARVVYFPFPKLIQTMLNNREGGLETLIFAGPIKESRPIDIKLPNLCLRKQLMKIGLSKEQSNKYCFHSWRHFYTTYMIDKVNQRALQSQTGHKSIRMLNHYGGHQISSDVSSIENAQIENFNEIVNKSGLV